MSNLACLNKIISPNPMKLDIFLGFFLVERKMEEKKEA
jgi:hypothetical protein